MLNTSQFVAPKRAILLSIIKVSPLYNLLSNYI